VAELRVELLATEDCPHLDRARRDLQVVLREGIVETPIQTVIVSSLDDAEFLGFQGSPTIRVNGADVDPRPDLPVGLSCRVYRDAEGQAIGSPSIELIRAVLAAHRRGRLEAFQREEAGLVADYARDAATAEESERSATGPPDPADPTDPHAPGER
jgi:hypothetical protein